MKASNPNGSLTIGSILVAWLVQASLPPAASCDVGVATISSGGGHIGSASYAIDGNLGIMGGLSFSGVTGAAIRHGYAGQLYDLKSLVISPFPARVEEASSCQLGAGAILDDGTILSLAPTNIAWSAIGPVASIDSGGRVTAANVYQNTSARVQAHLGPVSGGLELDVINVSNDDFGAYAGDGIDDAWQISFFGRDNAMANPAADPDGDGQNNLFEWIAGTVPTDAHSLFQFSIAAPAGGSASRVLTFTPFLASRTYTVLSSTNLAGSGFSPYASMLWSNTLDRGTLTDTNALQGTRYYRMEIKY